MSSLNPSWRLRVLSQELWGPVFSLGFRLSVDIAGQGEGLLAAFTSESLAWMVIQRRKGKGKGRVSRGMRVPAGHSAGSVLEDHRCLGGTWAKVSFYFGNKLEVIFIMSLANKNPKQNQTGKVWRDDFCRQIRA